MDDRIYGCLSARGTIKRPLKLTVESVSGAYCHLNQADRGYTQSYTQQDRRYSWVYRITYVMRGPHSTDPLILADVCVEADLDLPHSFSLHTPTASNDLQSNTRTTDRDYPDSRRNTTSNFSYRKRSIELIW